MASGEAAYSLLIHAHGSCSEWNGSVWIEEISFDLSVKSELHRAGFGSRVGCLVFARHVLVAVADFDLQVGRESRLERRDREPGRHIVQSGPPEPRDTSAQMELDTITSLMPVDGLGAQELKELHDEWMNSYSHMSSESRRTLVSATERQWSPWRGSVVPETEISERYQISNVEVTEKKQISLSLSSITFVNSSLQLFFLFSQIL